MATWFGPDAASIALGPVRIEKWRKQPLRTLLCGFSKGGEQKEVRPGITVSLCVSKGLPSAHSDSSTFCAGVRFTETSDVGYWCCPLDFRITLLGDRGSLTRTVRWIVTPGSNEVFFPVLPLTDAERFVSGGVLQLKAEVLFHLRISKEIWSNTLATAVQSPTLMALIRSYCLAGSSCLREAAANSQEHPIFRDPAAQDTARPHSGRFASSEDFVLDTCILRPGLLPSASSATSATAVQELAPGLFVSGHEPSLQKLWQLGVSYALVLEAVEADECEDIMVRARFQEVEIKQTNGTEGQNGARLVPLQQSVLPDEVCSCRYIADATQKLLSAVLSFQPFAQSSKGPISTSLVVLPHSAKEAELCAALAVEMVARLFQMPLLEARRYVSSRWDVPVGHHRLVTFAPSTSETSTSQPRVPCWEGLDSEEQQPSLVARWFAQSLGVEPSLAAVRLWDRSPTEASKLSQPGEPWAPWRPKAIGDLLHVHDMGWGTVPEIFRAYEAWRSRLHPSRPSPKTKKAKTKASKAEALPSKAGQLKPLGPLATLRFLKRLLPDEILAFPYSFKQDEGQTWHLVALVCHATRREAEAVAAASNETESKCSAFEVIPRRRTITFLHGAKEWLVDGNGHIHEIQRWQLAGSAPDAWLCTRDLSPQLAVYSTQAPRGFLQRSPGLATPTMPAMPANWRTPENLSVRIVTEKMLQKTRGCLAGGFEIPSSAELKLSMAATVEDLKQQVHQVLRIPTERQLLFQIPDSSQGGSWLVPVQSPLSTLLPLAVVHGLSVVPTVLLMFQSNDADPATTASMLEWHAANKNGEAEGELPCQMPILCRYFCRDTLSHYVLGVLLISPGDTLLQHLPWLRKRIALGTVSTAGTVEAPPLAASLGTGPGQEASPSGFWLLPLRMDCPLKCQIHFGAAVDLEVAACGHVPATDLPQMVPADILSDNAKEEQRMLGCLFLQTETRGKQQKGIQLVWSAFAKALKESSPNLQLDFLAAKPCRYHVADALPEALTQAPAGQEAQGSNGDAVAPELRECREVTEPNMEPLSVVVFHLHRPGLGAESTARRVAWSFAADPESGGVCKGKLGRHRPREICLLHGTPAGAQARLWTSLAPGSDFVPRPFGPIPLDFLAALDFFGVPRFLDVKCMQIGPAGVPLAASWTSLNEQEGGPPVLAWELEPSQPEPSEEADKAEAEEVEPEHGGAEDDSEAPNERVEEAHEEGLQLWGILRARRKRWADETDSDEGQTKVVRMADPDNLPPESSAAAESSAQNDQNEQLSQSPGCSPSSINSVIRPAKFTTSFGSPKSQMLSSSSGSPKHRGFAYTDQETSEATGTHSPSPEPAGASWSVPTTQWKTFVRKVSMEAPNESREGEPVACESRGRSATPSTHSSGLSGARSAERCPQMAKMGICFEGAKCRHQHSNGVQLARAEPCPFGGDSRESCPLRNLCAFTHGEAEQQCPPIFRARGDSQGHAQGHDGEESAANVVKRSLGRAMDQVLALLAEARALGLVDDVRSAERRLNSVQRLSGPMPSNPSNQPAPQPGPSQEAAVSMPRGALSRASSCDSFFDGENLRFVLAPSTPGDITRSNSPRSAHSQAHIPQVWEECQGYHGIYRPSLPCAASIDSALRNVSEPASLQSLQVPSSSAAQEAFEEVPASAVNAWQDAVAPLVLRAPLRRRSSKASADGPPSLGFMWHTSPFAISRTPNIHTPVSHHSPARSPTSFSGYCSPIPGFPSGVASPNQRRSGYSSPSTMGGAAFFAGAATQSGLMRRLMSLREARGEEREDDSEWSSGDSSDGGEAPDLLELLLKHAERVAPRRASEPRSLCLDLSSELLPVRLRGLLPCHAIPFFNAWVQALLACSPLAHLLAQVSWQNRQPRPAYNCLMQLAWEFYGSDGSRQTYAEEADSISWNPARRPIESVAAMPLSNRLVAIDATLFAEPLLRRFERGKSVQEAPVFPNLVAGPADMFSCFLRFFLGELHDECKWPTLSAVPYQHEDSPMMRIFGGLVRTNSRRSRVSSLGDGHAHTDVAPFLLLHLDLADPGDPKTPITVEAAVEQVLRRHEARFLRLPPFLLIHLQRFRTGSDGLPDRVSRKCRLGLHMELEEATGYTLRSVAYHLRSAICHYGEIPESGAYKAFALHLEEEDRPESSGSAGGNAGGNAGVSGGSWHVLDDAAVRCKQKDIQDIIDSEGHHACFLMFRRGDTKTVNLRPHAVFS